VERYYRNGKSHRDDGPANIERRSDGSAVDEYYRDGKLHREDGPADIRREADGWSIKRYYREDKLIKTERLLEITAISGVSFTRNPEVGPSPAP